MISAEIAVSGYILQPPRLPQIPTRVEIPSKRLRDLALLAKTLAEARELLKEQSDKFEAFFELVLKADVNADEIERMAESLMAQQKMYAPNIIAALETLDKHVSAFRESNDSYLNGPVLRSAEEGVDIGRTWLELYRNLYIRLMKLASDRLTQTAERSPVFSDSSAAESYIRSLLSE